MSVVLKRTDELDSVFFSAYTDRFNAVFSTRFTANDFVRKYRSPATGFSLHAIVLDDLGRIGGMNTIIPVHYEYEGRQVLWGLHCDTFLAPERRGDLRLLLELLDRSARAARDLGISVLFGIPNDNSYLCFKQMARWRDVGSYEYYVLPRRVGRVLGHGAWLNLLSRPACGLLNLAAWCRSTLGRKAAGEVKPVHVVRDDAFWSYRLQQADYHRILLPGGEFFVYRLTPENGIPCAHIIDYYPRANWILEQAVRHICREHSQSVDLVLFAGHLSSPALNLVRVPRRFRPRELRFCAKVLAGNFDRIFTVQNWELGILLMDTR